MRVLILTAAIVVAVFTQACEKQPTATRVDVEVFMVGLAEALTETLRFIHHQGDLTRGNNPDIRAKELTANAAAAIVLIHSTSWRWEKDGRIVLTYLAWVQDGAILVEADPVPNFTPPGSGPTDPLRPRPSQIRKLDPLAHGLRHLAFLLHQSTDGSVAAAVGPRASAVLEKFTPAVAGKFEGVP
jgi:hypothetical protein